ncbi:MAG: hypothetical protein RI973_756 [Bacteroidota bacterium]|jgi:hypothetical protein
MLLHLPMLTAGLPGPGKQPALRELYLITAAFSDTTPYLGYRLHLTSVSLVKESEKYVKINCTLINSGRMNVDFGNAGTAEWVPLEFDESLFQLKLGGLRDNIRLALQEKGLRVPAGAVLRNVELRVSTLPTPLPPAATPAIPLPAPGANAIADATTPPAGNSVPPPGLPPATRTDSCPDLHFASLVLVGEAFGKATIDFVIENRGLSPFPLSQKNIGGNQATLVLEAFISGVTVLTRGALPANAMVLSPDETGMDELLPGQQIKGKMQVDTSKKTRYLKSLILSLDSDFLQLECDRSNNVAGLVLE